MTEGARGAVDGIMGIPLHGLGLLLLPLGCLLPFLHKPRSLLVWGLSPSGLCMDGPFHLATAHTSPPQRGSFYDLALTLSFQIFFKDLVRYLLHLHSSGGAGMTMGKEMQKSLFDSNEDGEKNIAGQWKSSCTHCISGTRRACGVSAVLL